MGFWNTKLGIVIRWVAYIPFGLILLVLTEITILTFLTWLFGSIKGFLWMFLLGGGSALGLIFVAIFLFHIICSWISKICPKENPGMTIFCTIYVLFKIFVIVGNIFAFSGGRSTLLILSAIICSGILIYTTKHSSQ